MDIRTKTCLIVKAGNEYLVGRIMGTMMLKWSTSPWDAWMTRDRAAAEAVAGKVDGTVMLFNPVAKQLREAM